MSLVDEVSRETVVGLFDVWLLLDVFGDEAALKYEFLRDPARYDALRRPARKAPRPTTPPEIQPLSPTSRDDNRFWGSYFDIGTDTLTPWDRQEPFRLNIPDRIRVVAAASSPRILCEAPEVFLFPAGWSTTLWMRILDPLKLGDLPSVLWKLGEGTRMQVNPGPTEPVTLRSALDALRGRVGAVAHGPALARRARRIIGQRIVSVIAREDPEMERPYLDEDLLTIYGALEPAPDSMGPLWRMARSSQQVEQAGGMVVIRYGRGVFIDMRGTERWRRCHARNLRNMIMMCAVLQATVKFGVLRLPEDDTAFEKIPASRKGAIRDLHRLVVSAQRILRQIPQAYATSVCTFYCGQHQDIRDALSLSIPALPPE